MHENQTAPLSFPENWILRLPEKTDTLIYSPIQIDEIDFESPEVGAKVIDGAAIINMLVLSSGKTFQDFVINNFVSYVVNILKAVRHVDIVGDRYFGDSLKASVRDGQGADIKSKGNCSCLLRNNWATFLWCIENKAKSFPFLSGVLEMEIAQKLVVAKNDGEVMINREIDCLELMPSNKEQGDEEVFLHVLHSTRESSNSNKNRR